MQIRKVAGARMDGVTMNGVDAGLDGKDGALDTNSSVADEPFSGTTPIIAPPDDASKLYNATQGC